MSIDVEALRAEVGRLREALGHDVKNGDGLIAAAWWALDQLDLCERYLIEIGLDAQRIHSPLQLEAHEKARRSLEAARAALAATPEPLLDTSYHRRRVSRRRAANPESR